MKNNPSILAVGNKFSYEDGCKFLHSTGLWDSLTVDDRETFLRHGAVLDTPGGNKLGIKLAELSAQNILIEKHAKN